MREAPEGEGEDVDVSSIQTTIQDDPEVRVSVAWRQSRRAGLHDIWYWEAWCFSDDPRLRSFLSDSTAYTRERAQRIHDGIVRSVTGYLRDTSERA